MKKLSFIVSIIFISLIISDPCSAQKRGRGHSTAKDATGSKDMLSMLQGRWSSIDDKKTFFQIEGDKQIDIYGRDILDTGTINFYNECPKRISAEDEKRRSGKYLTVQIKPDDFYCYSIEKISAQQLVLIYLPKGSLLRYKKVPAVKLEAYNSDEDQD